jgi:hypothetical protein
MTELHAERKPESDTVVVLVRGGRLPAWHDLDPAVRRDYEQRHVDLMLDVAREHRLLRIEGFRLIATEQPWARFWVIEFPTLEGAEAWIRAEMAPPYGAFGAYEYHLARPHLRGQLDDWVPDPRVSAPAASGADPHRIPHLDSARDSVVVLLWGRWRPEALVASPDERGDAEHNALMKGVAREHGMMRIEAFASLGPQADWHRAWVMEFPTFEGAEAWLEAEVLPRHGRYAQKRYTLARRWAPDYFATWSAWALRNADAARVTR